MQTMENRDTQEDTDAAEIMGDMAALPQKAAVSAAGAVADFYTGNYVGAAVKTVKAVACILGAIGMFFLMIACFFEILFHELGFQGTKEYAQESYNAEASGLKNALTDYFEGEQGTAGREAINGLFLGYDGTLTSAYCRNEDGTAYALPSSGVLAGYYQEIEADYGEKLEAAEGPNEEGITVVYEGCSISCNYDLFWENGTYLTYFVPMLMNKADSGQLARILEGNTGELYGVLESLITATQDWASWTVEEECEDISVSGEMTERHIWCSYRIKMSDPAPLYTRLPVQEYFIVKDEETLKLAVTFLSDLGTGEFGASAADILKDGSTALEVIKESLLRDSRFSWRAFTVSGGFLTWDASLGEAAAAYALCQVGCEYDQDRRMDENPNVFDCSSLVARAYAYAGYPDLMSGNTAFTARQEYDHCLKYGQILSSASELCPGDLIFTTGSGKSGVNHVMMYVGDGMVVHARGTRYGVVLESFKEPGNLVAYARCYIPG